MPEVNRLLREKPVSVSVEFGDDSISVTFDANRIVTRWMTETLQGLEATDLNAVPRGLAQVILAWDLTQDGQSWAPSAEHLAELPMPVLMGIYQEISAASSISSEEGNGSSPSAPSPSSDYTPVEVSSPNGSETSSSQKPSESLSST